MLPYVNLMMYIFTSGKSSNLELNVMEFLLDNNNDELDFVFKYSPLDISGM